MAEVADALPEAVNPTRRRDALELLAVLTAVAMMPLGNFIASAGRGALLYAYPLERATIDVFEVGSLAILPVLCLMARDRHGWGGFGVGQLNATDVWLAVLATLTALVAQVIVAEVLRHSGRVSAEFSGLTGTRALPSGAVLVGLLAWTASVRGIVLRSFVVTRIRDVTGSGAAGVALSALAIGMTSWWYGLPTMCVEAAGAAVLGGVFAGSRRLWPTIAAEFVVSLIHVR